jgi:hypothetical protein
MSLLVSPWFFFMPGLFSRIIPVDDGATTVLAPLRVSARHQAKVRTASQRRLKRLLRSNPIYAKLLDEHPIVLISVPPAAHRP